MNFMPYNIYDPGEITRILVYELSHTWKEKE